MRLGKDSVTYAAFVGAAVCGGGNFVAVSVSNRELPPLFGAAVRFGAAATLFLLLGRIWKVPLARGKAAASAAVYGLLGFGTAYAFLYYALLGLPAGTVAVIMATVPLLTLLLAVLVRQESLTWQGVAGGAIAVAGIVVLRLGSISGAIEIKYLLAVLAGAASVAGSSVIAKALPQVHPVNLNAIGMLAGVVLLVGGSLIARESWVVPQQAGTWMALTWLVTLGSVGLFQLFLFVVKRWTASASAYIITAMPVIAVVQAAIVLDQPITGQVVAGGSLVILAVYVGAVLGRRRPTSPAVPPVDPGTGSSTAPAPAK